MAGDSAARVLVLYAQYTDRLSYYDDWLDAFNASPLFNVTAVNIVARSARDDIARGLGDAELVVLLHSTNGDTTIYLEPFADQLADRRCPLLSFVGNEVNLPGSPISAKRDVLRRIRPDYVATQLLKEAGDFLWGDLVTKSVVVLPHALNPDAFRPGPPQPDRPIDIGVRAVRYLPHLGDSDRNGLHDFFDAHSFAPDLKVDISAQRFDRDGWAAFLQSCKATVSSEAGTWWLERDDATIEAIRTWTAERMKGKGLVIANDSPLRRIGHKLPWWLRAALRKILSAGPVRHESTVTEDLPADEIYQTFFVGRQLPEFYGKCISSRHFDAAGTGTVQILLEGRYNDILEAGVHYLPLKADFSNIAEVMAHFRDPARRTQMAQTTLALVMEQHTYARRIEAIHALTNTGT
jgi:hypothetical protein